MTSKLGSGSGAASIIDYTRLGHNPVSTSPLIIKIIFKRKFVSASKLMTLKDEAQRCREAAARLRQEELRLEREVRETEDLARKLEAEARTLDDEALRSEIIFWKTNYLLNSCA